MLDSDRLDFVCDLIDRQDVLERIETLMPAGLLQGGRRQKPALSG